MVVVGDGTHHAAEEEAAEVAGGVGGTAGSILVGVVAGRNWLGGRVEREPLQEFVREAYLMPEKDRRRVGNVVGRIHCCS